MPPVDVLMVLIRTLRGLEGAFPPDTALPPLLGDPASVGRDCAASTSIFSPTLFPPSLPSVLAVSCPFSADPLSTSISSSSSLGSRGEKDGDEEATAGLHDLLVTADVGMEDLGISGSGLSDSRLSLLQMKRLNFPSSIEYGQVLADNDNNNGQENDFLSSSVIVMFECKHQHTMSHKQIYYSDKYDDDKFEYRHVMLPKDIAKKVPKTHLMSETEWRNLGVQQSQGWVHYMIHQPEPHILLFRRPLPQSQ
uniref:Cyclin-dependent kinases regulatory subunit n=3 Tax=Cyprininae TaxID=2743694 RepID=A0A8C1H1U0_CYPCA